MPAKRHQEKIKICHRRESPEQQVSIRARLFDGFEAAAQLAFTASKGLFLVELLPGRRRHQERMTI